jgi:hypothetical protein
MNAPDMQRVRMSLPHYREYGWEPFVLAIDPTSHGGLREDALTGTIPSDISVHRCQALPLKWSRKFGIGNLGLRSWLHLFLAGARIIRCEKIDLIFFSNTQFISFTLGRIWRCLFSVPYVIDLQDPWLTNYYKETPVKDRPGGWKYTVARFQAGILERWSFRRMSGMMSVSQRYLDDLGQRYDWFRKVPVAVINFGASKADLVLASKIPTVSRKQQGSGARMVYTGVAGTVMQSALAILFDGLSAFRRENPVSGNLRFAFLGTSYANTKQAAPSVVPIARRYGADELVFETPTRLGLLEALREQVAADALLLLGSPDPAYSASKLYLYYLSGRPILAIVAKGSVLEQSLRELACAVVVTFESTGPNDQTRSQLAAFFRAMLAGFPTGTLPARNDALFQREYLADSLTRRQCELFDRALSVHALTSADA